MPCENCHCIECNVIDEMPSEFVAGSFFFNKLTKQTYILIKIDSDKAALVCLYDGSTWRNPIKVNWYKSSECDFYAIREECFKKVCELKNKFWPVNKDVVISL